MQNMNLSFGDIMGPDVPSPSNMWVLTVLFDGWLNADLYQWVPIDYKPLEDETVTFTTVDDDKNETQVTVKMLWYDSMRELQTDDHLFLMDPTFKEGEGPIAIAKWDDTKKTYKYSVRFMYSTAVQSDD